MTTNNSPDGLVSAIPMKDGAHTPGQRYDFEMSPAQLEAIFEAIKPAPYMVIAGMAPKSQQECANLAWESLGSELGFDYMTVRPDSRGVRFFSAVARATGKGE